MTAVGLNGFGRRRRDFRLDVAIGAATTLLGLLSFQLERGAELQPPIWLPAGLMVGWLLRRGWGGGACAALGILGVGLIHGTDLWLASVAAVGSMIACLVTYGILRRLDVSLRQVDWRSALLFLLASALGGAVFAMIAAPLIVSGNVAIQITDISGWIDLWLSHVAGVIILAPLVVMCERRHLAAQHRNRLHAALWLAGFILFLVGLARQTDASSGHLLISVPLVLMVWPAIAVGRFGTALAAILVPLAMVWATAHGYGPFLEETVSIDDAVNEVLLFMGAAVALAWILVGFAERQQRANRDLVMREEALNQTGDGIVIANAEQRVIYVNAGFERLTGYCMAEMLGISCSILHGPDTSRDTLDAISYQLDRALIFSGNVLNYRKDGSTFWNDLTITPLFDNTGEVKQYVGVLRDATDRVISAKALADALDLARSALAHSRDAEARYASILHSAMVGIISVDQAGRIISYNREAEVIFGHTAGDMIGQRLDRLLPEEKRQRHQGFIAGFAAGSIDRQKMSNWRSVTAVRRDGSIFQMMAVISKVEVAGSLTMTVIFRDMTEIVDRERDLERLVGEKELEAKRAQAADVAKSQFLANMSHELRTPLNAIIGFSELIAREQLGPIERRPYVEFAEDIRKSGMHLLSMISEVLDLSRIGNNKYDLHCKVVDPNVAVDDAISQIRARALDAGLTLRIAAIDPACRIWADEAALAQILGHLLSNAVKFTQAGGTVDVRVFQQSDTGMVVIEVKDNGRGIPADRLPGLGRPFEQVADSYVRDVGGTGLGLAICVLLAKAMSGEVTLESEIGKGTVAHLSLPAGRSASAPAGAAGDIGGLAESGK
ncbi:MAG: PAS domain S-box protein [Rhodospirillaceae bacterium]|nr:PAS domain S-box protein [Rhodospirillaceae bacterium]